LEQRGYGSAYVFCFVASWNDGDNAGPGWRRGMLAVVVVERAQAPEVAAAQGEIEPDRQRNCGESDGVCRHGLFCNEYGERG
jgi:hypothetical protein